MTDRFVKRSTGKTPLWEVLEDYNRRVRDWKTVKTVCVAEGLAGSGKTTWLLNYFMGKRFFYFSFAGLEESLAEKLFCKHTFIQTGVEVSGWEDAFKAVSSKYKRILLDDLSSITSYKRFHKAFYDNMIANIYTRPFIVLITQPNEDVSGLADKYIKINLGYFSIPEVMKLYSTLSKYDALGLCAVSGGIPKIFSEYDNEKEFEDNLRNMLNPSSAFCTFMPELLSKYFRRPECYHHILYAIANGNHRVSEIGKFTGYTYNKCDNYLAGLMECGFVEAEKAKSKTGAVKTAYQLTNSYFRLWYLYIFNNLTAIRLGHRELTDDILHGIIGKEIHKFHLQKAFALVNGRIMRNEWERFRVKKKIPYEPQTVMKGKFSYTFDAICKHKGKMIFIKVFENPFENCNQIKLMKIRRAIEISNVYFDSQCYIFSKRRFSDYAVAEAARDEVINLVEVDRLKY